LSTARATSKPKRSKAGAAQREAVNAKQPHEYSRRVFLAVSGLSPAIVTESVYALAVGAANADRPSFIPTEVHVVTTAEGKRRLNLALFDNPQPQWRLLLEEYRLTNIDFSLSNVRTVLSASNEEMEDIRSPDDNLLAANLLIATIRKFTSDSDCALHVSIAGGRKTMGFFAGYAFSLFARSQDRLSHVLVDELYEKCPNFFFPTRSKKLLKTREGREVDAHAATVLLAEIPVVRLRLGLPDALLSGATDYRETVEAAELVRAVPRLEIDVRNSRISASGKICALSPTSVAIFSLLAHRARAGLGIKLEKGTFDKSVASDFLAELKKCIPAKDRYDSQAISLKDGMGVETLRLYVNRLRNVLELKLGRPLAAVYAIGLSDEWGYTLKIDRDSIEFRTLPRPS
jgi:CRISPR-associated protein (TIGR02584 family)